MDDAGEVSRTDAGLPAGLERLGPARELAAAVVAEDRAVCEPHEDAALRVVAQRRLELDGGRGRLWTDPGALADRDDEALQLLVEAEQREPVQDRVALGRGDLPG